MSRDIHLPKDRLLIVFALFAELEGRQDKLGEAAYERFNNRYFLGEKVVVHHAIWPHGLDGPQTFQQCAIVDIGTPMAAPLTYPRQILRTRHQCNPSSANQGSQLRSG